jgi:hypothetical protein
VPVVCYGAQIRHENCPGVLWKTRTTRNFTGLPAFRHILGIGRWCIAHVLKREGYDSDNTHYLHTCRRHHNRAVTGLWLAGLHDGKRGTCQVSQGAPYLVGGQPLLDVRGGVRASTTTRTRGRAGAFLRTRTRGRADAFLPTRTRGRAGAFLRTRNRQRRQRCHRSAMSIFAM